MSLGIRNSKVEKLARVLAAECRENIIQAITRFLEKREGQIFEFDNFTIYSRI